MTGRRVVVLAAQKGFRVKIKLKYLKSPTKMRMRLFGARFALTRASLSALVLFLIAAPIYAQQHVSKRFVAGKNVRLELKNIAGQITVESWDRDEIKVSATLESPAAHFSPRQSGDDLIIDVMGDNRGRGDVGDVNFKIQLPASASLDLETRRGDIHVYNVHGGSVRARVSSEGDITLSGVNASQVSASNTSGNIFFDGEFARGGTYQFQTGQGEIAIRIPANSDFRLVAAAPSRKIALNQFWNTRIQSSGDGRKVFGDVGDGRASVTVTNFKGGISFIRR
jgi:Putative adhesin